MKANSPKSKPKFEWIDVPIRPLPRHVSFVLEDILMELRKISESIEKVGIYPVPSWYPTYYTKPSDTTNVEPNFNTLTGKFR